VGGANTMFSVKMDIHEDAELREHVKSLIKGQVKAGIKGVIREEVMSLTNKKYGSSSGLEELIKTMVKDALTKDTKLRKFILEEAHKHVRQEVGRVFSAYREDYSDVDSDNKTRKLDLGIPVNVSKGLL